MIICLKDISEEYFSFNENVNVNLISFEDSEGFRKEVSHLDTQLAPGH